MEYLDREGGKYLATKLKSYVDNKHTGGGTVDLTNYYTKEETDQLLANLPSGGTGTKGDKGDAGVGVSSIKLVNYELIITLTDGTVHNLGNVRGEKGKDGAKGTDGVSPTVSVTEITNGHTVAITDVNGTQSFNVLNGKDGKDGASGGSSGGASVVYSTDETAIGTWIDGKTIYRKVYQIPKLDSVDGDFDRTDVNLNLEVDSIINIHPIWKYGNNSGTVIVGNYCTLGVFNDYNTSSMASTLNEQKKNEMNVTYDFGANSKKIQIWRGSSARSYSCTLVLEYTKM